MGDSVALVLSRVPHGCRWPCVELEHSRVESNDEHPITAVASDFETRSPDALSQLVAGNSNYEENGDVFGVENGLKQPKTSGATWEVGQFAHRDYRPEEFDSPTKHQETLQMDAAVETQGVIDYGHKSEQYLHHRNPFEDHEDTGDDALFGSLVHDIDDRPDPEIQGYSLLRNHEDAEGHTIVDVDGATEEHAEDNFNRYSFSPQQPSDGTGDVNELSQVQSSISEGGSGLEDTANQLVDTSNPTAKEFGEGKFGEHGNGSYGDNWWGSHDDKVFDFGGSKDQTVNSAFPDLPPQTDEAQEQDPFPQIQQSSRQSHDPFAGNGLSIF